jgi:hypothetical protein
VRPPPPGAPAATAREFVVGGGFKGARCLLPFKHVFEACPGYHVIRVSHGAEDDAPDAADRA